MKSYGVTIQMKHLQQYFHMVLFFFQYFTTLNLDIWWNFDLEHFWAAVKRRVMEPERGRNYKKFYLRLQSSLKLSLRSHKRGRRLARKQSSWLQATCSQHNLVKTDAFGRMHGYLKANLNSFNAEKHRFFCLTPSQSSCIAGNQNECYRKLLHDALTLFEFLSRKLISLC